VLAGPITRGATSASGVCAVTALSLVGSSRRCAAGAPETLLVVLAARLQARIVSGSIVLSLLLFLPRYQSGLPAKDRIDNCQLQGRVPRAITATGRDRPPIRFQISSMTNRSGFTALAIHTRGDHGQGAVAGFRGWTIIGEGFIARMYDGDIGGLAQSVTGLNNPLSPGVMRAAPH